MQLVIVHVPTEFCAIYDMSDWTALASSDGPINSQNGRMANLFVSTDDLPQSCTLQDLTAYLKEHGDSLVASNS